MPGLPTILFVEVPGQKPLPHAPAIQVASQGCRAVAVTGVDQALQILESTPASHLLALVSNTPDASLFKASREHHLTATNILVTDTTIHSYSQSLAPDESLLIDHIIANLSEDWTIDELRITLQKIVRRDLFGIEKYLLHNTPVQSRTVKSSRDRETYNTDIQRWVETCGLSRSIARLAFGVSEELLMNAIYDAPIAGGRSNYESLERTTHRDLLPDEYSTLRFGCDGRLLALSIQDPFGAFPRDKWWLYSRKILKRNDVDGLIDTKKGGAGLGIFKMLYSSHGLVCNVDPGKMTEVIVLIDLTQPVRDFMSMPRSIHYFNSQQC